MQVISWGPGGCTGCEEVTGNAPDTSGYCYFDFYGI